MPKPKWLKDIESGVSKVKRKQRMCYECEHYGDHVKWTRHRGKEMVDVHECSIHTGCLNTKYSMSCSDFVKNQLL